MSPEKTSLVVTCEHAGRKVPAGCASLFEGRRGLLDTHRACDRESLPVARLAAGALGARLFAGEITRLVVDLNRSQGSRSLFSPYSKALGSVEKKALIEKYYLPYRQAIISHVEELAAPGRPVVHLSVHTFAPKVRGVKRKADVGLLYDPSRVPERLFCGKWMSLLRTRLPALRLRRNYPYRGRADGLTTALRRLFPPRVYLGIELEVNQRLLTRAPSRRRSAVERGIVESLADMIIGRALRGDAFQEGNDRMEKKKGGVS